MRVRAVRPDEWRDLRALRLRALASDPPAFGRTLVEEEAQPEDEWERRARGSDALRIFVAEADGAWVGMAGAHRADEGVAELFGMWVAPEARGTGTASALIRAVVDQAREWKADRVTLWVNVAQTRALRVYAREGFERVGDPEPGTRFPERMFQLMARPLAGDR